MSSLCELAGKFVVTTRTAGQTQATKLTFSRSGVLQTKEPAAHPIGTTVSVSELFAPLPVRRQALVRSSKKHYAKMLKVLQGYAVVATHVRLSCGNLVTSSSSGSSSGGGSAGSAGKGKSKQQQQPQQVLSTQGQGRMSDNVANVFGAKFLATLVPFSCEVVIDDEEEEEEDEEEEEVEREEGEKEEGEEVGVFLCNPLLSLG